MNVIIDSVAVRMFHQFADRAFRGQQRYYYASDDYPSILQVSHGAPLAAILRQVRFALIDYDSTDSNITLDMLPTAPARWRDIQIVSVSLKADQPGDDRPRTLSEALGNLKVHRE